MTNTIARNNASRKAGLIPAGCNGWFHPVEKVILHSATLCAVHDKDAS